MGPLVSFVFSPTVGVICLWFSIGIPCGIFCLNRARPDAMSGFEAWLLGQLGGPVGVYFLARANKRAAENAALRAREIDTRRIMPETFDAPPPPPGLVPGAGAFQPPPQSSGWLDRDAPHS